jgi:hypothetical protein
MDKLENYYTKQQELNCELLSLNTNIPFTQNKLDNCIKALKKYRFDKNTNIDYLIEKIQKLSVRVSRKEDRQVVVKQTLEHIGSNIKYLQQADNDVEYS